MNKMKFNPLIAIKDCTEWINDWFNNNGPESPAVIGISGGKDSTVAAALCVKALGKERVIGVLLPNGEQADIDDAKAVCEFLGIKHFELNISLAYDAIIAQMNIQNDITPSKQTRINLAPRIRMTSLYAVSQSFNGRVVNTCNLSEDYVGYSTKYGDAAGDFSPLSNFTVTEVKAIGKELGLPEYLIEKAPSDGLCGKTDEDNLGFTYDSLDRYIRFSEGDSKTIDMIEKKHCQNMFKMQPMPSFSKAISNYYSEM